MIPSFSRVRSIRARVATVVPIPTSKRLTVLAETPACLPRSRTPHLRAALAIRICSGVIISTSTSDNTPWTMYKDPCTLYFVDARQISGI